MRLRMKLQIFLQQKDPYQVELFILHLPYSRWILKKPTHTWLKRKRLKWT